MVLFVLETLLASALLGVAHRLRPTSGARPATRPRRLRQGARLLLQLVLPFSLVPGVLLLGYAAIDAQQGPALRSMSTAMPERARWMAMFCWGAPCWTRCWRRCVRSTWIESAAAWQASRTSVMVIAFLIGTPLMLWSGNSQGYFWVWFGLRLFSRRQRAAAVRARTPAAALPRAGREGVRLSASPVAGARSARPVSAPDHGLWSIGRRSSSRRSRLSRTRASRWRCCCSCSRRCWRPCCSPCGSASAASDRVGRRPRRSGGCARPQACCCCSCCRSAWRARCMLGAVTFIESTRAGSIRRCPVTSIGRMDGAGPARRRGAGLGDRPGAVGDWLETGVAWQGSRTAVLFLGVLLGWPIMLFTRHHPGFFWMFFGLRLLSDLAACAG